MESPAGCHFAAEKKAAQADDSITEPLVCVALDKQGNLAAATSTTSVYYE
jgi:isoaspartyl peptidase/L-asparaginase-like protein (Ntn-hydrolase superfamily)